MSGFEAYMQRAEIERSEKWGDFLAIPRIKFPSDWEVQMVPPFGGAIVRFWAWKGETRVSVYFDGHDRLGSVGSPYWEIYPAADGGAERFLAGEVKEMIEAIDASLNGKTATNA